MNEFISYEATMELTGKQAELWHLAEGELKKVGGFAGISRSPSRDIRQAAKTEGTREWALLKSRGVVSGVLSDEECQHLIDLIRQAGTEG